MERLLVMSPGLAATANGKNEWDGGPHVRINRMLGAVLSLVVMLILKQHYSTATAGQLAWILGPTAQMTAWLTGANPVWESGVGYADFTRGIIIAPACAGLNFMIMAFGLAALCGLLHMRRLAPLLIWLALSLAAAYTLALAVNTLRIAGSMWLYKIDIYGSWITIERIHRLVGTLLYLCALGLFFKGLQPIINRYCACLDKANRGCRTCFPAWWPIAWYLLGAVGVPTANLLLRNPAVDYAEHCITVVLVGLTLWACGWLVYGLNRRFHLKQGGHANKNLDRRG